MKTLMVTGAGRGLGLAITERVLREGYRVIGIGRTLTEDYQHLMAVQHTNQTHFYPYDLNDIEGIPALMAEITRQHGALYGLINNAGIGRDGILATMHQQDINAVLRVNLHAPIVLSKFACRSMLRQQSGRIINIASIIATTGFNGLSVYGATKAGLIGFSRSLARELGKARITVNCIAPGFIATEMTAVLADDQLESVRRRSPLGLAEPKDIAGAVAYLLSDDAHHITGTTITVDGGSTA